MSVLTDLCSLQSEKTRDLLFSRQNSSLQMPKSQPLLPPPRYLDGSRSVQPGGGFLGLEATTIPVDLHINSTRGESYTKIHIHEYMLGRMYFSLHAYVNLRLRIYGGRVYFSLHACFYLRLPIYDFLINS